MVIFLHVFAQRPTIAADIAPKTPTMPELGGPKTGSITQQHSPLLEKSLDGLEPSIFTPQQMILMWSASARGDGNLRRTVDTVDALDLCFIDRTIDTIDTVSLCFPPVSVSIVSSVSRVCVVRQLCQPCSLCQVCQVCQRCPLQGIDRK